MKNDYKSGLRFKLGNKDYSINYRKADNSGHYILSVYPTDLRLRYLTVFTQNEGTYKVIEISRNIKQTGIKSTISNLNGMRLLYNNFNEGLRSTHTPPQDTQPTNFSLKLYKFILYSGRYKEKEGENRMIFEGSPKEEARRLGFDLRINDVDSSGVQTITLSNPITFNTEEYMRKHTNTNLSKSFNFN